MYMHMGYTVCHSVTLKCVHGLMCKICREKQLTVTDLFTLPQHSPWSTNTL